MEPVSGAFKIVVYQVAQHVVPFIFRLVPGKKGCIYIAHILQQQTIVAVKTLRAYKIYIEPNVQPEGCYILRVQHFK